jgi:hypothetical protein
MTFNVTDSNGSLEHLSGWGETGNDELSKITPPPSPLTELQQQALSNQESEEVGHTPLRDHDLIDLTHSPTLERRSISPVEGKPFQTLDPVVDWEVKEPEGSGSTSSSSSSSSSSASSTAYASSSSRTTSTEATSSSYEITSPALINIKKEISNTLHNHNIQTQIEIAVLNAYRTNNTKLSQQDQDLLDSYITKLEFISQFEESVSQTLKAVEDQGGGIQATLDVYDHFWGAESGAYIQYASTVKDIVDLSPSLSALLQDNSKIPGIHSTFGRFVTSKDRRYSVIRELKENLIQSAEGTTQEKPTIDSTIKDPRDKAGGAMYMQWLSRVPMLLSSMVTAVNKAGGDSSQLQRTLNSAQAKVTLVNTLRQRDGLMQDQGRLVTLLSELPQITPQTMNEVRAEKARVRGDILFIREKLAPVRASEENPEDYPNIDERISSRALERKVDTLNFWLGYITNTVEPQIQLIDQLIDNQDELMRLQEMYWPERNKMTEDQLNHAIDKITQNLEPVRQWERGALVSPVINRNLRSAVLEAQLIDFKRLQLLNIQQLDDEDVTALTPDERRRYLGFIEEALTNIALFQAIPPRRQIRRTQLRRVRELL